MSISRAEEFEMPERLEDEEAALVARLRSGDKTAFAALVDDLHGGLLAFTRTFTSSPALAEDIVQETWLAVIRGLHAFDARSSIKTWVYSILVRRARTMAARDARQSGRRADSAAPAPEVEWEPGQGRRGLWEQPLVPWQLENPESVLQSHEAMEVLQSALDALPEVQRQAVLLRDVEGLPATDVCNILGLSETNQRVVLHRGRARLRRALDRYVQDGARSSAPAGRGTEGKLR
jgi:RNA polymerase sigma-70 factor (ECF subfamily)